MEAFSLKYICSDCTKENFAVGKWKVYPHVNCYKCNKRTICRKIRILKGE